MYGQQQQGSLFAEPQPNQMNFAPQMGVMDPSPFAPPGAQCKMTRDELQRLLEQSGYGQNQPMFQAYFVPGMGGGPPLCCACMQPISAHSSAGAPMMMMGQQPPVGFGLGATLLSPAGMIDPNALPQSMIRSGNVDTFSRGSNIPVAIGFVLLAVAGLLCISRNFIGPAIVGAFGVLIMFADGPLKVTFDRSAKTVCHDLVRIMCWHSRKNFSFSDIAGVVNGVGPTSDGGYPSYCRMLLKLKTGETLTLTQFSYEEGLRQMALWTSYFNQNGIHAMA